jgi:hypothetical protein
MKFLLVSALFVFIKVYSLGQIFTFDRTYFIYGGGEHISKMCEDSEGNLYLLATYSATCHVNPNFSLDQVNCSGYDDLVIIKTSSDGAFYWAKKIGGTHSENGWTILCDNQDNLLVGGSYSKTVDFDPGPLQQLRTANESWSDGFLLKLNQDGEFIDVKTFPSTGVASISDVQIDEANNIYVSLVSQNHLNLIDFGIDSIYNSNGAGDLFIVKIDSQWDFLWMKKYGGVSNDFGGQMEIDLNGDLVVVIDFMDTLIFPMNGIDTMLVSRGNSDGLVLKLSSNGDFLWAEHIGGNFEDILFNIEIDSQNNYWIDGQYVNAIYGNCFANDTLLGNNTKNSIILKLNSSGELIFSKNIPGSFMNVAFSSISEDDTYYFTSNFKDSLVSFDENVLAFESNGLTDILLITISSNGDIQRTFHLGNEEHNNVSQVFIHSNQDISLIGSTDGNTDFDPNITTSFLNCYMQTGFQTKWKIGHALIEEKTESDIVFVNPSSEKIIAYTDLNLESIPFKIVNALGQDEGFTFTKVNKSYYSDVSTFERGVYWLVYEINQTQHIEKIIIY